MHIIQTLFSWLRCELTEQGHRGSWSPQCHEPGQGAVQPIGTAQKRYCMYVCMYVCIYMLVVFV
jgi:hypothetical protein